MPAGRDAVASARTTLPETARRRAAVTQAARCSAARSPARLRPQRAAHRKVVALTFDDGPSDFTRRCSTSSRRRTSARRSSSSAGDSRQGAFLRRELDRATRSATTRGPTSTPPERGPEVTSQIERHGGDQEGDELHPVSVPAALRREEHPSVALARSTGLQSVQWDVDTSDYERPASFDIMQRVLNGVQARVDRAHARRRRPARPDVGRAAHDHQGTQAKGYSFVTLDELLGRDGSVTPELPEVERARLAIERGALGRRIAGVDDSDSYVCRPHAPGEIAAALDRPRADRRPPARQDDVGRDRRRAGARPAPRDGRPRSRSTSRRSSARGTASCSSSGTAGGSRCVTAGGWAERSWIPSSRGLGPDAADGRPAPRSASVSGAATARVKPRIMDQGVVAGLGNLLVDEVAVARAPASAADRRAASPRTSSTRCAASCAPRSAARMRKGGAHTGVFTAGPRARRPLPALRSRARARQPSAGARPTGARASRSSARAAPPQAPRAGGSPAVRCAPSGRPRPPRPPPRGLPPAAARRGRGPRR